jgi:hypothetical protein
MLAFGYEPNPDADDGTFVATLVDVTRPDEQSVVAIEIADDVPLDQAGLLREAHSADSMFKIPVTVAGASVTPSRSTSRRRSAASTGRSA